MTFNFRRWVTALLIVFAFVPAAFAADEAHEGDAPHGTVRTTQYGPIKIHTYTAPAEGWLVNSQIVEGPKELVVFDGQLLLPYARELADFAAGLGKPVTRIIGRGSKFCRHGFLAPRSTRCAR